MTFCSLYLSQLPVCVCVGGGGGEGHTASLPLTGGLQAVDNSSYTELFMLQKCLLLSSDSQNEFTAATPEESFDRPAYVLTQL